MKLRRARNSTNGVKAFSLVEMLVVMVQVVHLILEEVEVEQELLVEMVITHLLLVVLVEMV